MSEDVRRPEDTPHPGGNGAWRPTPGYVAILAGAAVLILVVGALLKPDKLVEDVSPVALTETTPLMALARRSELRDQADFLSGRVSVITPHLVYLSDLRAGGVVWGAPDSVLTSGAGATPLLLIRRSGDTLLPPLRASAERLSRRGWVLLAARQADGSVASAVGMSGGVTPLPCGDRVYRELVLATPLDAAFKGGGLFDLEGDLLGVVGRCGSRYAALSVQDVQRALRESAASETRMLQSHGIGVTGLDEPARGYFGADSGVLVGQVVRRSAAGAAGLRPGDVIVGVDTLPVRTLADLESLLPPDSAAVRTLALVRDGRSIRVRLSDRAPTPASSLGLELAQEPEGIPITGIAPGSLAERAGLRAGDRILRVGRLQPRTPAQVQRTLERTDRQPVYLVYLRDDTARGVLLP